MNDYVEFVKEFFHTRQSLEAFESCPLRFYKRYFEGLRWDKLLEPDEASAIGRGSDFHMLACRYFLGLESGLSEGYKDYDVLSGWLKNLKGSFGIRKAANYLPEYKLRCEDESLRLEANFDLVVAHDDKLEIWDWKTHTRDNGRSLSYRGKLEKSLQSMVYLYVLKERSAAVFGREYDFGDIRMYYWQPEPAQVIAGIAYSRRLHESFGGKLAQLVKSIEAFDSRCFDKNAYSRQCRFCEFNWYCNKGKEAD